MGLARFSIYQYARTSKGWRYSRPFYGKNNKLQPKAVLVDGTYLPPLREIPGRYRKYPGVRCGVQRVSAGQGGFDKSLSGKWIISEWPSPVARVFNHPGGLVIIE